MRQNDFTMEELLTEMRKKESSWPKCLILSEVGAIVYNGEDKDALGEKILLEAMKSPEKNLRFIAFCWLSTIPGGVERHEALLKDWGKRTENKTLLVSAKEAIREVMNIF